MKSILLTTGLLSVLSLGYSQKIKTLHPGAEGRSVEFLAFEPSSAPVFSNKAVLVDQKQQISYVDAIVLKKDIDLLGGFTYRLQQSMNGIPVKDGVYNSHVKNGRILSQNGHWFELRDHLPAIPVISEAMALASAKSYVHASVYKWELADEEAFIKEETGNPQASFFPRASLLYFNMAADGQTPVLRLAYQFDIYAHEPMSRKWVFVDALNGKVLGSEDRIHETNVIGTATTGYSGNQTITTDSYNGSYRLRETGRGNGIQTFNLKQGTNYRTATDFTDTDNNWNNVNAAKDQYATDAHWGAEMTYDFYKNNFARNSIDNAGFAIKSYVHYSRNYFNAFWDGSRMTYGDGSSLDNYKPLTSLDVCGHEITHGLTSFSARLNYSYESGALNEGFSDIFGTAVEWFARPANSDWLIGGDFYTIRSMSNPKAYSQPKTYLKQYWYTGTSDNGGVHTNSGVLNYWFYLLSVGGSGTNDNGFTFNVSGITMSKAQAIAYRALTSYLVSTSKYADARKYTILAAEDLYGVGSNEAVQTKNAWDACGVGGGLSAAGKAALVNGLNVSDIQQHSVIVYPNPTPDAFNISFNSETASSVILEILDPAGRTIIKRTAVLNKGINQISMLFPSHAQVGKYQIRVDGISLGSIMKK